MTEKGARRTGVLVNPVAGRGPDPARGADIVAELRRRFPEAPLRVTQRAGAEREAVRELLAGSIERLVVAGGDGTLHGVVDALFALRTSASDLPVVQAVPLGSGNDFARGLGLPLSPLDALDALGSPSEVAVDVGQLTFLEEGTPRVIHWLNQSYLGFGARVVERVARASRPAVGSAYSRAAVRELRHARPHRYSLESDTRPAEEVEATNLLIANGRFSGSGMLSSPRADPTDAKLDVLVVGPVGRLRLLSGLRRFRAGTHLGLPEVATWRVERLTVRSDDPYPLVEADGDIVGRLPCRYEILPRALRFRVPEPSPPRGAG